MSSEGSGSAGRGSQPASDSQASSISNWSDLQLSQGSVNTVLNAVGLSGLEGDRFIQVCASEVNNDEEEVEGDPVTGLASVSVSRTVIHASSVPECFLPANPTLSDLNNSTLLASPSTHHASPPPLPTVTPLSTSPTHSTPAPSPQIRDETTFHTRAGYEVEAPLVCYDPILTPPATLPRVPIPGPSSSHFPLPNTYNLHSNYPSNVPLMTDYKFEFVTVVDNKNPYSKGAHITFSEQTDRLYLKTDVVIPLHFSVARAPPVGAVVRVMAIYKAPEVIAQNITCCLNHIERQKQNGVLFPHHFIRCKNEGVVYYEHPTTKRTSVSVPFTALQETHPRHRSPPPLTEPQCLYAGLFHFPCHTSHLQHGGRNVQLIFTLERGGEVLGRCVRDVRVCSSTGRDREKDESKVAKHSDDPPPAKRARKRALLPSTEAELHQCTLPSATQLCQDPNEEKVPHTVWTYRRLIPFVDVCVRMMEGVCNPVWVANGNGNQEQQEPSSTTTTTQEVGVAEWLEGAGLARYTDMLKRQGVEHTFQALAVTEQELRRWGMTNPGHRKQFLEAKSRIQTADRQTEPLRTADETPGTPPLFSSQSPPPPPPPSHPPPPSQGSQGSQPGTQPFATTARFEVVQIQMKKHISSSQQ